MLDEHGKPFWMKFFKADYLDDSDLVEPPKDPKGASVKGKPINVPQ